MNVVLLVVVGVLQAASIVDALGLKDGKGPFSIELFGGSPDDNNAFFFYDGAMSVIQPLIDSGDIVIPSGQTGLDKVGTLRWDAATAQSRMDNILSANYGDKQLHGVLSANDGLARGIISSVKGVGYGSGDLKMPIITGQDAEIPGIKAIIDGDQYSTVFKDTRELAKVTVGMVNAMLEGKEPEVNDTKTYDNGKLVVPSYLLPVVTVFADAHPSDGSLVEALEGGAVLVLGQPRKDVVADGADVGGVAEPFASEDDVVQRPRDAQERGEGAVGVTVSTRL